MYGGDVQHVSSLPAPPGNFPYIAGVERCDDVINQGDCQPLFIEKDIYNGGVINLPVSSSSAFRFSRYTADWVRFRDSYARTHADLAGFTALSPIKTDVAYATDLRFRTNPSRASVDVGVNAADMEHIPPALEEEARRLIPLARGLKFGSRKFIEYQFMIAPLVADILKAAVAANAVEQRVKELNRLYSDRGLRRTIDLDSASGTDKVWQTAVQSFGTFIRVDLGKTTIHRVRGHARWVGGFRFSDLPEDRYRQARSAILGLTIDPALAWNLVPWSWFVDWFGNIGEYLSSLRNTIDATMTVSAIMHHIHTRTRSSGHTYSHSDCHMTPIDVVFQSKSRALINAGIDARLPILTASQLGILGAIKVLDRLK